MRPQWLPYAGKQYRPGVEQRYRLDKHGRAARLVPSRIVLGREVAVPQQGEGRLVPVAQPGGSQS